MKKTEAADIIKESHKAEILFWLVIILLVVSVSSIKFMHKEIHDENDYHVFLPDVYGLIVGSPVRMMGTEVGHVVKIKPVKDEVYVKFILENPDLTIPRGTKITVEFSGMAGSKSLELYPPDKDAYIDKNTPIFDVYPPKRLRDALALLDDMYKKLTSIIWNVSTFGEKIESTNIDSIQINSETIPFGEFIDYSNGFLNSSKEKTEELKNKIEGFKHNGKEVQ